MTAANYIEVSFTVAEPGSIQQDLLIAALGEAGYESFLETSVGFNAYIREAHFSESRLQGAIEEVAIPGQEGVFAYEFRLIEPENWNQVWERNFSPVVIGNQCRIRASFHEPDPAFPLEIQIDPKMAFGTGHHETTWLMASWLLELSVAGKKVLDMGCGTGVLAILAAKKGAAEVLAADIDAVCVESTIENAALNRVELVCLQSDVRGLDARDFDVILANINRNVLLDDIPRYAEKLRPGDSTLLISGFYEGEDLDMLRKKAGESGFQFVAARSRNGWAAAQFRK
ncbi:MAG: 50S ribosomal protein L11 methyltransferase [Solitalea sp.]